MVLTLDLPDELSAALAEPGRSYHRIACGALSLEAARENMLCTGQLRRVLGFQTRAQVHEFLKCHDVWLHQTQSDLGHNRPGRRRHRTRPRAITPALYCLSTALFGNNEGKTN